MSASLSMLPAQAIRNDMTHAGELSNQGMLLLDDHLRCLLTGKPCGPEHVLKLAGRVWFLGVNASQHDKNIGLKVKRLFCHAYSA